MSEMTVTLVRTGSPTQCPACREHLGLGPIVVRCPACNVPHHGTCLSEIGCSSLGCKPGGTIPGTRTGARPNIDTTEPTLHRSLVNLLDFAEREGLIDGWCLERHAGTSDWLLSAYNSNGCDPWEDATRRDPIYGPPVLLGMVSRDYWTGDLSQTYRPYGYHGHSAAPHGPMLQRILPDVRWPGGWGDTCGYHAWTPDDRMSRITEAVDNILSHHHGYEIERRGEDGWSHCDGCHCLVSHDDHDYFWDQDGSTICEECLLSHGCDTCGGMDLYDCDGEGSEPDNAYSPIGWCHCGHGCSADETRCETCGGSGEVACSDCEEEGIIPCEMCDSEGWVEYAESLRWSTLETDAVYYRVASYFPSNLLELSESVISPRSGGAIDVEDDIVDWGTLETVISPRSGGWVDVDDDYSLDCPDCDGDGEIECPECSGSGEVTCPDCEGSGSRD